MHPQIYLQILTPSSLFAKFNGIYTLMMIIYMIMRLYSWSLFPLYRYIIATMEGEQPTMDDLIVTLPLAERVPVVALNTLLTQREKLDEDQEFELQKIHKAYADKIKPLLERASKLIQGENPLPTEVQALSNYLKSGEKLPPLKGQVIDRYWNAALENSSVAQFITQPDEKALQFLQDIQVVDDPTNQGGITLRFLFKANPYFTETNIVRKLRAGENRSPVCVEGDEPTWKAGNWLTHEAKKVNNKATKETKITKGKKIESFFDIFLNWSSENKAELSKCSQIFSELMIVIRDSLGYFLGLFDVDGEEESEDEDDYEDEDDDESEEPAKKAKK